MLSGDPKPLLSAEESTADGNGTDQKTDAHPFLEEDCFLNVALLVEGKRIWVPREYLGVRSNFPSSAL